MMYNTAMMRIAMLFMTSALASGVLAVGAAGCGGKKTADTTTPGDTTPRYIKKVSLSWQFTKAIEKSNIFLSLTNETGQAQSYPIETYDGDCAAVAPGAIANGVTAARCMLGPAGHEFHIVRNGGELIVLKVPVTQGAQTDPMAGTRLQSIPIPADAKLEASN
jgi:hypothetical protein